VMFVSIVFTTVNLITDLVYPLIDPRLAGPKRRRNTVPAAEGVIA